MTLAYRFPRSRDGHRENLAILRNVLEGSAGDAYVILASTIMVYGPAFPIRLPDAYGLEKLLLERAFRQCADRLEKFARTFRIGHALGTLQPLSRQIDDELRRGRASVASNDPRPSNSVHVASLADAICTVDTSAPLVVDLVTAPQRTWGEVYSDHARRLRLPVVPGEFDEPRWPLSRVAREGALALSPFVPGIVAERMFGRYLVRRARRDLCASPGTSAASAMIEATRWRGLNIRPLQGLSDTATAEARYPMSSLWIS